MSGLQAHLRGAAAGGGVSDQSSAPPLTLITGEVGPDAPSYGYLFHEVARLESALADAEADLRAKRAQIRKLKTDREREAELHPARAEVQAVFDLWRTLGNHPNSGLDAERFELIERMLSKHGRELCERAIVGLTFDPFVTTRKNGKPKVHDGLHLAFETARKFEDKCNAAPADWRERIQQAREGP